MPRSTPSETLAISASSRIEACSPCSASIAAARWGVRRAGSWPESLYSVVVLPPRKAAVEESAIRATDWIGAQ